MSQFLSQKVPHLLAVILQIFPNYLVLIANKINTTNILHFLLFLLQL